MNNNKPCLYFHSDAGHGWLAIPRKRLKEMGLLNKISSCSYQRGGTVYLEEDCDMALYLNAIPKDELEWIKARGFRESYKGSSPIRNYELFRIDK